MELKPVRVADHLSVQTASALVASASTEFMEALAPVIDAKRVHLTSDGAEALARLRLGDVALACLDFTALGDRWTGRRLLQMLAHEKRLGATRVYMLGQDWSPTLEQGLIQLGACGFVRRTVADVLPLLQAQPRDLSVGLACVDEVFGRFAGPMRDIHLEQARAVWEQSLPPRRLGVYVATLAASLSRPERRDQFIKAAQAMLNQAAQPFSRINSTVEKEDK